MGSRGSGWGKNPSFEAILQSRFPSQYFDFFHQKTTIKPLKMKSTICINMKKTFLTTLQSIGTHWEAGVLGGEKQSRLQPLTILGRHVGNLGFWVGIIIFKPSFILSWGLCLPDPLLGGSLCPHTPLFSYCNIPNTT